MDIQVKNKMDNQCEQETEDQFEKRMDVEYEEKNFRPTKNCVRGFDHVLKYLCNDFLAGDEDPDEFVKNYFRKGKDEDLKSEFYHFFDSMTEGTLFELQNSKYFSEIHGCISMGKEAKVYYAFRNFKPSENRASMNFAIKVYEQINLIFKNREKYTAENFCFRRGWNKSNKKNVVHKFAENEYKNLCTLYNEGLPVPKPVIFRANVLIMEFLGEGESPSPRLQDAEISKSKARELYLDIVNNMWIMYRNCQLVHGDLSEYNLLYHKGKAYIIDVSQSLSPAHPNAQELLCKDCSSITDFFRKKDVPTMSLEELFDYIVDPRVTKFNRKERLKVLEEAASNRYYINKSHRLRSEEKLFESYVINCRNEAVDYDRYISSLTTDDESETIDCEWGDSLESEENEASVESDSNDDFEELLLEPTQKLPLKEKRRPGARPKKETATERKSRKKLFKERSKELRSKNLMGLKIFNFYL